MIAGSQTKILYWNADQILGENQTSLMVFSKGQLITSLAKESVPKIQIMREKIWIAMNNTVYEISVADHEVTTSIVDDEETKLLENVVLKKKIKF